MFLVTPPSPVGALLILVETFEMMCEIETTRRAVFSLLPACLHCAAYQLLE